MKTKDPTLLELVPFLVVGVFIISIALWVNFFSPCWIFSWTSPPARCLGYFVRK